MSVLRSRHWFRGPGFRGPGFRGLGLTAVMGFGLIAGGAPAQAQFFGTWGYRRPEPPPQMTLDAVAQRLIRSGFRGLEIRRNGGVYLVDARDQGGRPVRLVVDMKDAAILQKFALANPRKGGADAGVSPPQPGFAPPASPSVDGARPRTQAPRAKQPPSAATITPAPEEAPPAAQPPVAVAAPALAQPPAPSPVGPGYANGVPINPLD